MKKIYNNPTIEVVKIQTQQMLAGSPIEGPGIGASGSAGSAEGRGDDDFDW